MVLTARVVEVLMVWAGVAGAGTEQVLAPEPPVVGIGNAIGARLASDETKALRQVRSHATPPTGSRQRDDLLRQTTQHGSNSNNRPSCDRPLAADCMQHRKATCTIQPRADETKTNALDHAAPLAHVHAHAAQWMPTRAWWAVRQPRVVVV